MEYQIILDRYIFLKHYQNDNQSNNEL